MNPRESLYGRIHSELMQSEAPSRCLQAAAGQPEFCVYPFCMLQSLIGTGQSPKHHREGDVWNHTMMVIDEAAGVREKSREPGVFMWAALLHDIGKPKTTKIRKGRITSYNHEAVGAEMSKRFLREFTDDERFIEKTAALIRWHMQILFVANNLPFARIDEMKAGTDVSEVALLGLCDRMGRSGADRAAEENNIRIFLDRCRR